MDMSKKILIIDDTKSHCMTVSKILEKNGYITEISNEADLGMEMAKNNNPDLILMDIIMPGLNGYEATRILSKDEKTQNIPVILLSSKQAQYDQSWGLRQGAKAYLVKPFNESQLLQTISLVLNKK